MDLLKRHKTFLWRAFTLIELLVVVAIIAVLVAVLLPSLASARVQARVVKAHAELKAIDVALMGYMLDNAEHVPVSRQGCDANVEFQLPPELAWGRYLPIDPNDEVPAAGVRDEFRRDETYKFRAPGPVLKNGSTLMKTGMYVYVPSDFPRCESESGGYVNVEKDSPVKYTLWSAGPGETTFDYLWPLPRRFWYGGNGSRVGIVTHFYSSSEGVVWSSP